MSLAAVTCLALAMYWESASSGQPVEDQIGVAQSVMHRTIERQMGPCRVVFEPLQYSSLNAALDAGGQLRAEYLPHGPAWRRTLRIARAVLNWEIPDLIGGATIYYADYIPPPHWDWAKLERTAKHGHHTYYREVTS